MSIGGAVFELWAGSRIVRSGWNGRGMFLYLVRPAEPGHLPFVMMRTAQGDRVPWLCSQTDLLADDWHVLPSESECAG